MPNLGWTDLRAPVKPASFIEHDPSVYTTLKNLKEWEVLGGRCGKCGHVSWLNKKTVEQIWGNHYLMNVRKMLRCQCGNKDGNKVLIGKLGRD